jgi:signal transduction histidine kinase
MHSIRSRPEADEPRDAAAALVLARASEAARRLHDTAGQSLVSAHRFVMASRSATGAGDEQAALAALDAATEAIGSAMRELRAVMDRLAPPELDAGGISAGIEHHGARRLPRGVTVVVEGDLPRAGSVREWLLLAVCLDALDRVAARPGTSAVRVALAERQGAGIIMVSGDTTEAERPGPAPDREALAEAARQAAGLGGRFEIASDGDRALLIRIEAPLDGEGAPGPGSTAGEAQP